MITVFEVPLAPTGAPAIRKPGDDYAWYGHIPAVSLLNNIDLNKTTEDPLFNLANNPWFSLVVRGGGMTKPRLLLKGVSSVTFIRHENSASTVDFVIHGIVGTSLVFVAGPEIDAKVPAGNCWNSIPTAQGNIYASAVRFNPGETKHQGAVHVDLGADDITKRALCYALIREPGGIVSKIADANMEFNFVVENAPSSTNGGMLDVPIAKATKGKITLDRGVRCLIRVSSEGQDGLMADTQPCVKLVGYWEHNGSEWVFHVTEVNYVMYRETGP